MRILIRRGQFINKGAEAMVRTVQSELAARIENVTFAVPPESIFANTRPLALAAGVDVLSNGMSRREKVRRLARRAVSRPLQVGRDLRDRQWMHYAALVEKVDAIVDVAGYGYGDVWGTGKALITQGYVSAARELGIPYIFLPQAWGPFDDSEQRPVYRRLCSEATKLYARDETSQEHLAGLLDRPTESIPLAPDIAFKFRGAEAAEGRRILEPIGLPAAKFLAGVAPNQKVYERARGTGFENEYVRTLCEVCAVLRREGASVVLIPHEIQPSDLGTTDDRLLCSMVAGHMRDDHVVAMTGRNTAEEIKGAIASLDVLIGSRFHALIAALSQGIPTAALGWSHKYAELLGMFGLEHLVVGHESLGDKRIRDVVFSVVAQRAELRRQITERLPRITSQVDEVFGEVAAHIQQMVINA